MTVELAFTNLRFWSQQVADYHFTKLELVNKFFYHYKVHMSGYRITGGEGAERGREMRKRKGWRKKLDKG